MDKKAEARLKQAMMQGIKEGHLSVPNILFKFYAKLGLTDIQAMLILHILSFQQKEDKLFPTVVELEERMYSPSDQVIRALQQLVQGGWIDISESIEESTGIRYEWYRLEPLFDHLCSAAVQEYIQDDSFNSIEWLEKLDEKSLFTTFENEFGRPLSPMECESLSQWMDQDRYGEELILAALKEAVFAGKLSFRYIDRILLEWEKRGIRTPEQAKEHATQFRAHQKKPVLEARQINKEPIQLYNWLEGNS
jgi:DNA replication protein